jgi:hypothetical protein
MINGYLDDQWLSRRDLGLSHFSPKPLQRPREPERVLADVRERYAIIDRARDACSVRLGV